MTKRDAAAEKEKERLAERGFAQVMDRGAKLEKAVELAKKGKASTCLAPSEEVINKQEDPIHPQAALRDGCAQGRDRRRALACGASGTRRACSPARRPRRNIRLGRQGVRAAQAQARLGLACAARRAPRAVFSRLCACVCLLGVVRCARPGVVTEGRNTARRLPCCVSMSACSFMGTVSGSFLNTGRKLLPPKTVCVP